VACLSGAELVVTMEDGLREAGVGAALAQSLRDHGSDLAVMSFGIPTEFLDHGKRSEVLSGINLTPQDVARAVVEHMASRVARDDAVSLPRD
jgi:1-deoxy-D-xylulose-5-phosphate synthase